MRVTSLRFFRELRSTEKIFALQALNRNRGADAKKTLRSGRRYMDSFFQIESRRTVVSSYAGNHFESYAKAAFSCKRYYFAENQCQGVKYLSMKL